VHSSQVLGHEIRQFGSSTSDCHGVVAGSDKSRLKCRSWQSRKRGFRWEECLGGSALRSASKRGGWRVTSNGERARANVVDVGAVPANTSDSGARQSRSNPGRLKAPRRLGNNEQDLEATLEYLEAIRRAVFDDRRAVYLDLSDCVAISPAGIVMLAAELHRCKRFLPNSIDGEYPASREVREMLSKFGFHQILKFQRPARTRAKHPVVKVTSRPTRPKEVASIAAPYSKLQSLFSHARFGREVETVIQEALQNVSDHAFDGEIAGADLSSLGRWWLMGATEQGTTYLVVLDHGPGVPTAARIKMKEAIEAYWQLPDARYKPLGEEPDDRSVLHATAEACRSGIHLIEHGRGFPQMIGLIHEWSDDGAVQVVSGKAVYQYSKVAGSSSPPESQRLINSFPGTLIVWSVSEPRVGAAKDN
jgi:hypothetical protein